MTVLAAFSVPDGYGVAGFVALLTFVGWIGQQLFRTARLNAGTVATLQAIDRRLELLENQIVAATSAITQPTPPPPAQPVYPPPSYRRRTTP